MPAVVLFQRTDSVLYLSSSCFSKGVAAGRLGLGSIDQIWDSKVSSHPPFSIALPVSKYSIIQRQVLLCGCLRRLRSAVCGMHDCFRCVTLARRLQKLQSTYCKLWKQPPISPQVCIGVLSGVMQLKCMFAILLPECGISHVDVSEMRRLSLQDMLQCSSLKETLSYMDRMCDECSK